MQQLRARSRYPESRSVGSAINAPTAAQTTNAQTSPIGEPPTPRCAIVIAPTPASPHCASDTWPARPMSGTIDSAMIPMPNSRAIVTVLARVNSGIASAAPATTIPLKINVPRIVGIGMISRVRAIPWARRRALGRTSSTMNSTITGTAATNVESKYWLFSTTR